MITRRFALLSALLMLSACAPRQQVQLPAPAQAQTAIRSASFYPDSAGMQWTYIPENEASSDPYTLQALGQSLFGVSQVQATQLKGRGAQQTWYRQTSDAGQRLLGFSKPGVVVTLTPPLPEYPAASALGLGATWSGSSRVIVRAEDGRLLQSGTVTALYKVLEQRQVTVNKQSYTVWVISRQMNDDLGGLFPASQSIWFTPYVGEVRTAEGLLLMGRNFTSAN